MYCCFTAVICGPERGREGDPVVVDRHVIDDMAVRQGGLGCRIGDWSTCRGELGGADGFPELHCRSWGWQGCFDKPCSLSHNSVVWVLGVPCMLFVAWLAISKVGAVVFESLV